MQDTLYREEILEHFHSPQNFGKLQKFTKKSRQTNPFCGDDVEIYVSFSSRHPGPIRSADSRSRRLDPGSTSKKNIDSGSVAGMTKEEIVEDISFSGQGCAISIASASILTDFAKGKTKKELTKISEEDMLELLGVEVSETRKKCALLALATLKDCVK